MGENTIMNKKMLACKVIRKMMDEGKNIDLIKIAVIENFGLSELFVDRYISLLNRSKEHEKI